MTQFSFPWKCDPVGDGGPASYSIDVVEKTNRYLHVLNPNEEGLIYWTQSPYAGLFSASNPGGNTVRIASGVGMVEGWILESDADEDFDVSGGAASAIDQIVMRKSRTGATDQTVRLELLRGPAGGITAPTQTSTTWEVPLWRVQLDAGGNFSSLIDVRKVINAPLGTMIKIEEIVGDGVFTAVDFQNIPDVFQHLKLIFNARTDHGGSGIDTLDMIYNNVAAAQYDYHVDQFTNPVSTYAATFQNNGTSIPIPVVTASSIFSISSPVEILIPGYKNSSWYKTAVIDVDVHDSNVNGQWYREHITGHLKQVAAISRLTFTPKSAAAISLGSVYSLYGIT